MSNDTEERMIQLIKKKTKKQQKSGFRSANLMFMFKQLKNSNNSGTKWNKE